MTGLWQVLGASDIPFDEMTKLDYLYVTNWSLREDLRLIMLTLPALTRAAPRTESGSRGHRSHRKQPGRALRRRERHHRRYLRRLLGSGGDRGT